MLLQNFLQDLRFALRSLAKSPGFTAIAVLTLALGIGVNTSMFSIIDTLLFRSVPFPDPDRIVMFAGNSGRFSAMEAREIREQLPDLSIVEVQHGTYAWSEPGQTTKTLPRVAFSRELLDVFRIQPALGRFFAPREFEQGQSQVTLLSHAFWQSQFSSDPAVLGRTLRLDGADVTVVGVMPESFSTLWFGGAALFRPIDFTPEQLHFRDFRTCGAFGRMGPDQTTTAIEGQLAPLAARLAKEFPQNFTGLKFRVISLEQMLKANRGDGIVWMLGALAGFVLLIACANLANLQLARTTSSARDFAVRAALGASHRRLVAQQLAECLLLAFVGGGIGLLVGLGANRFVEAQLGLKVVPGLRMIGIAVGTSLLTGMIFSIAPALFVSGTDVNSALKSQSRAATASRGFRRLRHSLIVGEVALAMVLLSGATVLNRGLSRMLNRPVGWDVDRITMARVQLPEARYANTAHRWEFYRQLLARIAAIPGVEGVTVGSELPMWGHFSPKGVFVDPALATASNNPLVEQMMVTPEYFATLGIPLREGRLFPTELKPGDPVQVVVDESFVRMFFPNESPIGKRAGTFTLKDGKVSWHEIVGVVGTVELAGNAAQRPSMPTMYRPFSQEVWPQAILLVRSAHPETLPDTIRKAAAELDPDLALQQVAPIRQMTKEINRYYLVVAHLLTGFAVLGLVLAVIGLYGVISHLVAQRTAEFGIRFALGAQAVDILRHVLKQAVVLTSIGVTIGLVGAMGLSRFLYLRLPRVVGVDPISIVGMVLLLLTVAVLASWLPARRATKVDPMTALRAE